MATIAALHLAPPVPPKASDCEIAVLELVAEAEVHRSGVPEIDFVRFAVTSSAGEVKERQLYVEIGGR
jgi:hypothetical protein